MPMLVAQFVQNVWIESYDPTIEDSYRKQIEVDGRQCVLEILDTAGTEQFTAMRELYMKSGQGFLLVFSITSASSFSELSELRDQIIRIKEDENVPLVIVGNKSDLNENRAVSRNEAFMLSRSWKNVPYYETSARRRENVDEVFKDACRQIILRENAMEKSHHRSDHARQAHRRPRPSRHQRRRARGDQQRCTIL
ncbi:MAG: Ras- protein rsr1 [Sarea resinae]|nr:MAG: Ras- protein rsr1 [Sarea resinae]